MQRNVAIAVIIIILFIVMILVGILLWYIIRGFPKRGDRRSEISSEGSEEDV